MGAPEVYTWALEDQQEVIPKQSSPLCKTSQLVEGESFLQISYPKEKTVFEYAPQLIDNQGIVFEVNVSANIDKVSWYINNDLLGSVTAFPFKVAWVPKVGEYTIKAIGESSDGRKIKSEEIDISVVEYGEVQ